MDPVTFSIIRHRLFRITDEAVITLKHVSGSAITNEGHDLLVALYRADGSLLTGGFGFLFHMIYASEACKAIIKRFGKDIEENDVFLLNDPYTAAGHTSDVFLIAPLHYRGALVGWSACFVHVTDIGAQNPGGFSPESRDIFTEGFSSPGIKLVSRGQLRQDLFDTILNMVRSPEMVALDIRSMIACNNVAKERMGDLIEKYGIETVQQAGDLLIAHSEDLLRRRIGELPRGEWRARQYMDVEGTSYKVCLALRNDGQRLTFDFTGSSGQSERPINCTRLGTVGASLAPIFSMLCFDTVWNEGIIRHVDVITPESSLVSATRPAPVSVGTVGGIQAVRIASSAVLGKMLAASPKYRREASAVWHANSFAIFLFGRNQHTKTVISILTENFAGAGGARTFADGVDVGGMISNPISRMANVETVESAFPVRYLFRRLRIDSAGAGKYRGGSGMEFAITPHDSPDGGLHYVVSGKGQKHAMTDGLSGGFPGARSHYLRISNRAADPIPPSASTLDEIPGARQAVSWGVYPMKDGEALYVATNGAGGYLDPLDRNPTAVLQDVRNKIVSKKAAQMLYGVVLRGAQLDVKSTEELRSKMLLERGTPRSDRGKRAKGAL
jgi:N-methylhydantoinase B